MQKDTLFTGILLGTAAPLLAYLIKTYTNLQQSYFTDKPMAIYIIAAVINLIAVRFAYRQGKHSIAKGIVLITFIAMLVLIFFTKLKV